MMVNDSAHPVRCTLYDRLVMKISPSPHALTACAPAMQHTKTGTRCRAAGLRAASEAIFNWPAANPTPARSVQRVGPVASQSPSPTTWTVPPFCFHPQTPPRRDADKPSRSRFATAAPSFSLNPASNVAATFGSESVLFNAACTTPPLISERERQFATARLLNGVV